MWSRLGNQGVQRLIQSPLAAIQGGAASACREQVVAPSDLPGRLSGGRPLDPGARAFFEARLGHDLTGVRLHTDRHAAEAARLVNARAFTIGRDVVFGEAQYETRSVEGRRLLAHELVHTVQQGASRPLAAAGLPLQPRAHQAVVNRVPKVAGVEWTVDHADVATGTMVDLLADVIAGLTGDPASVAKAYATTMRDAKDRSRWERLKKAVGSTSTWQDKAGLYVRAIDFLRDNKSRFAVPDSYDTIGRAIAYCDASSLTWPASLTDSFYENLLVQAVYTAGPGTAKFTHRTSKSEYHVPGRIAGTKEFAPSGRDALLRPAASPTMPISGGFPKGTDLLAGYGAQPGSVSAGDAAKLVAKHSSKIPARLRPFLETLATDGTIHTVLDRFLSVDKGAFRLEPVALGGAHYSHTVPPSIEVDPDLFPGSGADREDTEIGLRTTLSHELYHYALDRADAAITEVGGSADHDLIGLVEDRYQIIETIRAGLPLVGSGIHALTGYVGPELEPALKKLIDKNDAAGLKTYVGRRDFLDSIVYSQLLGHLSGTPFFVKTPSRFAFDPAQITDLAYLAAVNGVILRKAFETAADVSTRKGISLSAVWGNTAYQTEVLGFIKRFMALVQSNKTAGAAALAATI